MSDKAEMAIGIVARGPVAFVGDKRWLKRRPYHFELGRTWVRLRKMHSELSDLGAPKEMLDEVYKLMLHAKRASKAAADADKG